MIGRREHSMAHRAELMGGLRHTTGSACLTGDLLRVVDLVFGCGQSDY